jgi:uncharacterized protein
MKKLLFAALAVLMFLPLQTLAQGKLHHVVIALTSQDEGDWQMTIGNIHHLLESFNPDPSEIEVVAYGPGLNSLRKTSSVSADIQSLEKLSVRFVACENSMQHMHVTMSDLIPGVTSVPSGIGEVVRKEEQGWVYIKAGR